MYVFGFQLLLYLLVFSPLQIQKSYTWRHTSMHIAASSYLVYKSSLYFSSFETMMYCDKHDSTQTEGALSKINCKKFFEVSENIPTHPSLLYVAKPSSNQFTLINVLLNTSRLFLTIKKRNPSERANVLARATWNASSFSNETEIKFLFIVCKATMLKFLLRDFLGTKKPERLVEWLVLCHRFSQRRSPCYINVHKFYLM